MKKTILSLFVVLSSLAFASNPDVDLHKKCIYPTIMIEATNQNSYGTGVVVRSDKCDGCYKNVFLTAGHVFNNNPGDWQVRIFGYKDWSTIHHMFTYPAYCYATNDPCDL